MDVAFNPFPAVAIERIRPGFSPRFSTTIVALFCSPMPTRPKAIDAALGGTASLELLITSREGGLLEPAVLSRIDALQEHIKSFEGVGASLSLIDVFADLNRLLSDDSERVPKTRQQVAQLALLLEDEEDLDQIVQDNYSVSRVSTSIRLSKGKELVARLPALREQLARDYTSDDLSVEVTGFTLLMAQMETYLVHSQIRSFAVAFVVISLMMMLLLRSVKLGLFSMVPNCTPIVMSAVGIALDPGTVMIGSIALGLVVDDTVHFLVRIREQLAAGAEIESAIDAAMQRAARPIIVTSVVLSLGFAVMLLASFTPNIYFGLVSAVVIMLALIADLVALPALLLLVRPRL